VTVSVTNETRQLRVQEKSCNLESPVLVDTFCYPPYSPASASQADFEINGTIYKYEARADDYSQWGELAFYPGGGYVVDLPGNDSELALDKLMTLYVCFLSGAYSFY
jgi:hypothetical protein